MARRMFSPKVTSTDKFLDMPVSARELYFQLGMNADDDGFLTPKRIMRMIGSSEDDLKVLIAKGFVIPFQSGVIVITSWKVNNLIRKDWYQETIYKEEKSLLSMDCNGEYKLVNELVNENVPDPSTQVRLGKVRLGKVRLGNNNAKLEKNNNENYSEEFLQSWDIYPHGSDKGSKPRSYKNWCNLLKNGINENDLISACNNYKTLCETKMPAYRYKFSNFYGEAKYYENFIVLNITKLIEEKNNEAYQRAYKQSATQRGSQIIDNYFAKQREQEQQEDGDSGFNF